MKKISLFIISAQIFWSCSTTDPLSSEHDGSPYLDLPEEALEAYLRENLNDFEILLVESRSRLSDRFSNLQHDVPEIFTREIVREEYEIDEYAGFRVQILSTRDMVHADTTRDHFRAWAQTMFEDYSPGAYVHFRQPYYRVRAGDFRDRELAIEFARIIKTKYPEAWVVHDRISPENVPADTVIQQLRQQPY